MEDFEIEIKSTFLDEAKSLLEESEEYYMKLEGQGDPSVLDAIFRNAHSLKGGSKGAGFKEIESLTHSLEGLLLKIKEGEAPVTPALVSLLLQVNDLLRQQVEKLMEDFSVSFDPSNLIEQLEAYDGTQEVVTSQEEPEVEEDYSYAHRDSGYSDIPEEVLQAFEEQEEGPTIIGEEIDSSQDNVVQLDDNKDREALPIEIDEDQEEGSVNRDTDEAPLASTSPLPIATQEGSGGGSDEKPKEAKVQHDEKIRVSLNKIEGLVNSVGEMVILQSVLREEARKEQEPKLLKTVGEVGKIIKEVQDVSMGLRMVPIKQVFKKMQRIIRDSALDLGKKVNFHLIGEEVEVDKTVLDQIGDPLVHITRNAVDHGIEFPDERVACGKAETGEVTLSAYHESGRLIISMVDDGRGIDPKIIRKKAIEKNIIASDSRMHDHDVINLVFHAGFSTKEQVTAISGRGVGMDVVKTNIENLSGEISVHSQVNQGSELKISLPLTLAIIDGMILRAGERKFVIPLNHVLESVRITEDNVKYITGLGDVLLLRGDHLSLINLSSTLKMPECVLDENPIAIVVQVGEKGYAIMVDDILSRSQVVIKQLGSEIRHLKGFTGSTILGDGMPSLILEVPDVISMFKPAKDPIFRKIKKEAA